jgi:hypothetical protein
MTSPPPEHSLLQKKHLRLADGVLLSNVEPGLVPRQSMLSATTCPEGASRWRRRFAPGAPERTPLHPVYESIRLLLMVYYVAWINDGRGGAEDVFWRRPSPGHRCAAHQVSTVFLTTRGKPLRACFPSPSGGAPDKSPYMIRRALSFASSPCRICWGGGGASLWHARRCWPWLWPRCCWAKREPSVCAAGGHGEALGGGVTWAIPPGRVH